MIKNSTAKGQYPSCSDGKQSGYGGIADPAAIPANFKTEYAPVMELVDMRDLGSRAVMRAGSSPFRRTKVGASVLSLAPTYFKRYLWPNIKQPGHGDILCVRVFFS